MGFGPAFGSSSGKGLEFDSYAKSDTANTNIDVNDLSVNFVRI